MHVYYRVFLCIRVFLFGLSQKSSSVKQGMGGGGGKGHI